MLAIIPSAIVPSMIIPPGIILSLCCIFSNIWPIRKYMGKIYMERVEENFKIINIKTGKINKKLYSLIYKYTRDRNKTKNVLIYGIKDI